MAYGMVDNSNYKVIISQSAKAGSSGITVEGWIPETFQVGVSSQFNQPFGQQSNSANTAAKLFTNVSLTSQAMTAQVWEGSQPIELTLEIEFIAENDPKSQVLTPIVNLLKMTMPSGFIGGFLRPPGPKYTDIVDWTALKAATSTIASGESLSDAQQSSAFSMRKGANAKNIEGSISITLGNFMFFDNVVIESVNNTFHSMMHSSGIPLRATVAVTFKTFFVPVAEDLPTLFNLPPG